MALIGLNPLRQMLGQTVESEESCAHCGYSLKGIKYGSPCPECGTPMRGLGKARLTTTLTDAPAAYLRQLLTGCCLLLISGAGMIFSALIGREVAPSLAPSLGWLFPLPAALVWLAGVWIVTQPRQTGVTDNIDHFAEWGRLRACVRWSQAAWIAAFLAFSGATAAYNSANAAALAAINNPATANVPIGQLPPPPVLTTPPTTYILKWAGAIAIGIASLGLATLLLYLSNLAMWAADTTLGERLVISSLAWAAGLVLGVVGFGLGPVLGSMSAAAGTTSSLVSAVTVGATAMWGFGVLLVLTAMFMGSWALVSFANMSRWALKNSSEQHATDQRRSANINRRIRDNLVRPGAGTARGRDGQPGAPQVPADAAFRGVITVQPPTPDTPTFDLAPETPDRQSASPQSPSPMAVRHPPQPRR